ncbi:MAG: ATP-binding protein [Phycisphaerales bacterium]|nr:ATP-binding protein [Phycisphaerales bacterium]
MTTKAHFRVDPKLATLLGESYTSTERALRELVDNAWDADAERVSIRLPDPMTNDPIVIEDNGTGMTPDELRNIYLKIADDRRSRSKDDRTNRLMRLVKGRKGIGKFAGLAAAQLMVVETRAHGQKTRIAIPKHVLLDASRQRDLETIDLDLQTESCEEEDHGTIVTLSELDQTKSFPQPEVLRRLLVREYVRADKFQVTVNGDPLKLEDIGGDSKETTFEVSDGTRTRILLTIAAKPLAKSEAGFVFRVDGKLVGKPTFCGLDEEVDIPEKVRNRLYGEIEASGLPVTADWGELIENSHALAEIKQQVRAFASSHVREVCKQEVNLARARLAREYKARIEALPEHRRQFATEAVERVLAKYFAESDDRIRMLAGLVLDALEHDEYYKVCENIANAAGSDVMAIAEFLEEFGLVDMAVMVNQARRRLAFLDGFEKLATDKTVKEAPVHQAVERNLWMLGAQYGLIASNRTLKTIVEKYLEKNYSGKRAANRPDLFLGTSVTNQRLLIEFKKPSETVGRDDEAQATKYRDELSQAHGMVNIEVLIVGGKVDAGMSALYQQRETSFKSYEAIIADARNQLSWLLKELTAEH